MSKIGIRLVALAVLVGACASEATEPGVTSLTGTSADSTVATAPATTGTVPNGPVGLFASELVEFDSCEAFLAHIKAEALERVGPYGFNKDNPFLGEAVEMMVEDAPSDASVSAQAGAVVDYSTTNVQEVGVDEPDLVKTDGARILAVGYRALHYIDVSSGVPELVSSMPLLSWNDMDLWNQQIFMIGDTVLLMAHGLDPYARADQDITLVAQVDLSDPDEMRVVSTLMIEAGFVSARLVGERVALVVSASPTIGSEFVYPSSSTESAESRAERVNRSVIEESTLEHCPGTN